MKPVVENARESQVQACGYVGKTEPGGLAQPTSYAFEVLRGVDVRAIPITIESVRGYMLAPEGHDVDANLIGHPCGRPDCPYALVECTVVADMRALANRMLRDTARRYPDLDILGFLRELKLDVWDAVGSPLRLADLTEHPVGHKLPDLPGRLWAEGGIATSGGSAAWELVRSLRDVFPDIHGLKVRPASGGQAEDYLIFADCLPRVARVREGRLSEALPAWRRRSR